MITFRLRRPNFSTLIIPLSIFRRPLLLLLFFFFLPSSADLLNAHLLLFRVKFTNLIAVLLFCGFFIARALQISKSFFSLTSALLICMLLSLLNSPNLIASAGLIVFFLFNYFVYFLIPYNQFRSSPPDFLLKMYAVSFYCTGMYALCQIFFSLIGVKLPGVTQYIAFIARGTAFAYEPSFYALYMTPFAMYCTTKFILQDPAQRTFKQIFWPNLFLLASTSTGCFFSYLFFLFFILIFNYFRVIRLSTKKLIVHFTIASSAAFGLLWLLNKDLVMTGLLKFFHKGGASHFSVQDRWRGLTEYWDIFLEHPFIGVSFGGGPFYLALQKGMSAVDLLDPGVLGNYSPMNVTTEVLASVGLLGGFCFFCFFFILFTTCHSALRISLLTKEERINLIAFAISICVMFMTLQFNQSIMRAYMWIHIGVFCGYARHLKEKYQALEHVPSALAPTEG